MQEYHFPAGSELPDSVAALSYLLHRELKTCGIRSSANRPRTLQEFTPWYLHVVQLLEAHVASDAGRQPMSRSEVELMCRCALTGGNLRRAVNLCEQYCAALAPRAGKLQLKESGTMAYFHLDSLRGSISSASSLSDIAGLFAFQQLFQWLVGADLQLKQVRIGPIDRDDVLPFLKLFGAPVLAGGQDYVLEFSAAVLDLPVVRTAAQFDQFFELYPCGIFQNAVTNLPEQVSALLSASARQGSRLPSQAQLARSLGLPLSTFRRHLLQAGSSFYQLKMDCRQEQAEALLLRRENSIAEVASRLGYSDAAAFRRAFRRWQGCAPGEWRRKQRTG